MSGVFHSKLPRSLPSKIYSICSSSTILSLSAVRICCPVNWASICLILCFSSCAAASPNTASMSSSVYKARVSVCCLCGLDEELLPFLESLAQGSIRIQVRSERMRRRKHMFPYLNEISEMSQVSICEGCRKTCQVIESSISGVTSPIMLRLISYSSPKQSWDLQVTHPGC